MTAPRLLLSHLGWSPDDVKRVLVETDGPSTATGFEVRDDATGTVVLQGSVSPVGRVAGWHTGAFAHLDLTPLRRPGTYRVVVPALDLVSPAVRVAPGLLVDRLVGAIVDYFRVIRCAGAADRWDRAAPFTGRRSDRVDVHGGWYDASGDDSKYLSHLSYANYLNPQQTPLVVWALLEAAERLGAHARHADLLDEARYGADFLVRMQDPAGYFYMTVFDGWTHDPTRREICAYETQEGHRTDAYQAGFRQGGGMAVAALARASRAPAGGAYDPDAYLDAAVRGFAHLQEHTTTYLDDGVENVIDDYCALLAAVELHRATGDVEHRAAADDRAGRLVARLCSDASFDGWLAADAAGERPFSHAADEGLPVVALLAHLQYVRDDPEVADVLRRHLGFWRQVTEEVTNPFLYPRQYTRPVGGHRQSRFFFPHANESGYWWQGENARLASIATAARRARATLPMDAGLAQWLGELATAQVDWILGANPFDACMVAGVGRNNPPYPEAEATPGGVCNGITAGLDDEDDVALNPTDDERHSWRWGEQWIPHAAWLLLALTAPTSDSAT